MKTVIVVPTYNEKENLRLLVPQLSSILPEADILIVDDSSPDGTADTVRSLGKKFPRLHLLSRSKKDGLGRAYLEAFQTVLGDPHVSIVIMMDADLSHDPKYLTAMLEAAAEGKVAIGSRYVRGGQTVGWAIWRRLLSFWANWYCRLVTRVPVTDLTGGFYAIPATLLRRIDRSCIDASGYAFQIELKYLLWKTGALFRELPIIFHNRREGESKISNHIIFEGIIAPWRMILKK